MIDATAIVDLEHLDVRLQLLELAAFFDRLERASGEVAEDDLRLERIRAALQLLAETAADSREDRTQMLSLIFSGEDARIPASVN